MDDKKLPKKIIAEDPALQEVDKLGTSSEQVAKAADRIKPKQEQEAPKNHIAALDSQGLQQSAEGRPGGVGGELRGQVHSQPDQE